LVVRHLAGPTYFLYAVSQMKSTTGIQKLRGRPKTGKTPVHALRIPDHLREQVDAWIAEQPDPRPSRSEAIRRLVEQALAAHLRTDAEAAERRAREASWRGGGDAS
jgi:Arc/MetJ-type ribon-helix-helix transcriptional regulator